MNTATKRHLRKAIGTTDQNAFQSFATRARLKSHPSNAPTDAEIEAAYAQHAKNRTPADQLLFARGELNDVVRGLTTGRNTHATLRKLLADTEGEEPTLCRFVRVTAGGEGELLKDVVRRAYGDRLALTAAIADFPRVEKMFLDYINELESEIAKLEREHN